MSVDKRQRLRMYTDDGRLYPMPMHEQCGGYVDDITPLDRLSASRRYRCLACGVIEDGIIVDQHRDLQNAHICDKCGQDGRVADHLESAERELIRLRRALRWQIEATFPGVVFTEKQIATAIAYAIEHANPN